MNKAKTPLFSVEERVKMLKEVTKDLGNVKVVPFDGLLVEFARQQRGTSCDSRTACDHRF